MDGDNAIEALAEAIEDSLSMLRPTQRGSSADLTLGTVDTLVPGTSSGSIDHAEGLARYGSCSSRRSFMRP